MALAKNEKLYGFMHIGPVSPILPKFVWLVTNILDCVFHRAANLRCNKFPQLQHRLKASSPDKLSLVLPSILTLFAKCCKDRKSSSFCNAGIRDGGRLGERKLVQLTCSRFFNDIQLSSSAKFFIVVDFSEIPANSIVKKQGNPSEIGRNLKYFESFGVNSLSVASLENFSAGTDHFS